MTAPSLHARGRGAAQALAVALALTAACTPTVKIEAPDKPIEINLNVHIQQDVRVKLDRELDTAFRDHPELFGSGTDARKPEPRP